MMSQEIPDWAIISSETGRIKRSPDFDLLYRVNYEDYLSNLRTYSRINEEKRKAVLKRISKDVYKISRIRAIVDVDIPTLVFAFVAYEYHGTKLMVHFAFTKPEFRKQGFCRAIIQDLERDHTKFSYSAITSKPRTYSLFKNYKMETLK